jgi:hypothetical protein
MEDEYAWMILSREAQLSAQYNQTGLLSKGWRVRHSLPEGGSLIKKEREDRMVSSRRNSQMGIAEILFVIVCTVGVADLVLAGDGKTKEPAGVVDQAGTALKNTATKIEQELSSVLKKLQESETPKKVCNELKRSAESLGPKVEQAGSMLKDSFKSE